MKIDISLIYKIWSFIKSIFWKNSNIIYINSNKKIQSKEMIDKVTTTNGYHWVICQSNTKLGYSFYKYHLLKMKKSLYDITRNSKELNRVTYSGFVSPMFAVYDGYVLGDNRKYCFIDSCSKNSKSYKIDYEKKTNESNSIEKPFTDIVNVLFPCSFKIKIENDNNNIYKFNTFLIDKVTEKYLQEVYSYAKRVFDLCNECGVKRINLYISAKQPVSFIIGTAIQSYHPPIYIYEYEGGKYTYSLLIQKGKIIDINDK